MAAKQEAEQLINEFLPYVEAYSLLQQMNNAKQCALITINKILNTIEYSSQADELSKTTYLEEVKQEIENYEIL